MCCSQGFVFNVCECAPCRGLDNGEDGVCVSEFCANESFVEVGADCWRNVFVFVEHVAYVVDGVMGSGGDFFNVALHGEVYV